MLVPVHNEAEAIGELFLTFDALLRENNFLPRFLIVNDASTDGTLDEVKRLRVEAGYSVKVINLGSNVGQHASLVVGTKCLEDTDYTVVTDADLQNPPETAIDLLRKLKAEELNIVYGLRKESRLGNGFLSKFFWLTIGLFSLFRIPRDQTPLKVFDKRFVASFKELGSYSYIFYPFNLARVKARAGYYPVSTVARKRGFSKYNLVNKLELFIRVWATILFGYGFKLKPEILSID